VAGSEALSSTAHTAALPVLNRISPRSSCGIEFYTQNTTGLLSCIVLTAPPRGVRFHAKDPFLSLRASEVGILHAGNLVICHLAPNTAYRDHHRR
jgi:hypothetical protein